MYTFKFIYSDNTYQDFEHIVKVAYSNESGECIVSGEEIHTHKFPATIDLYLYSEKISYVTSSKNLKFISITKED